MKLWAVKIKSEDDVLTFVLDFLFLVYNITNNMLMFVNRRTHGLVSTIKLRVNIYV